jgi:hypothetical protein
MDQEAINNINNNNNINNERVSISESSISNNMVSKIASQSISIADNVLKNFGIQSSSALQISEKLAIQLQKTVQNNKTVSDVVGCANETFLFTMDYVHTKSLNIYQSLTADDPETMHWRSLRACSKENWDSVRLCMASLTWTERQLLEETKEDYADDWFDIMDAEIEKNDDNDNDNEIETIYFNGARWKEGIGKNQVKEQSDNDLKVRRQEELEPTLQKWLSKAASDGDEEAQYALTRWFAPPEFVKSDNCFTCKKLFDITLFRHHCRFCGLSFCTNHSSHKRKILRYGITTAVRVCNSCARIIDMEEKNDSRQWRRLRTLAYLQNKLIPYFCLKIDRRIDKALRVIDGSIKLVKNTLCLNYPAHILIETLGILKRFGFAGLAGVLLRKDFIEAVETLKRISGMDKTFPISLHELTACIYYLLAINRGIRGCNPESEFEAHQNIDDRSSNTHNEQQENYSQNRETNLDADLEEAIRMAPLALTIAYEENSFECQRLALCQGWSTIFTSCQSAPEQPSYVLLATDLSKNYVKKEVVVAIRGTKSVHDLVTDIRAAPQEFPPSDDEINKALSGYPSNMEIGKYDVSPEAIDENDDIGQSKKQWEWLVSSDMTYACGGMARSAYWLLTQVGQSLLKLHSEGYDIIFVGHSLGGGVAALATALISVRLPVRCITYGSPSCVDSLIATDLKEMVTSWVLHDDIISRLTPQSIRILMKELLVFREKVFRHLEQDWSDVIQRATALWTPKFRDHISKSHNHDKQHREKNADSEKENPDSFVIVEEDEIKDLYLPGKIYHIYSHRGQYKAVEVCGKSFDTLRRIEVQGNIFSDHDAMNIFNALLEVRAVRNSASLPPVWESFSIPACQCCSSKFTWHTTLSGETQEYRERYNCRNCGSLICDPCSKEKRAIPRLGLIFPVRICDKCFHKGDFAR